MKVLILGSDSMLAYALRQVFSFEQVYALGHKECDITDWIQVRKYLDRIQPEIVINCAAYTNVDLAQSNSHSCELVNTIAVKDLAGLCQNHKCKLLHFSTEMVFGQEDQEGYAENREPRTPLNVYGRTKLEGEHYIRESLDYHWIIRTSWMFGPGGTNFITKILETARCDGLLYIASDQIGSPTYTFDLARAAYKMVQKQMPFGTYHITNTGTTSKSKWAWEIIDYTTGDTPVRETKSKNCSDIAKRPLYGILHNTKLPLLRPWTDAMEEYLIGIGEIFAH